MPFDMIVDLTETRWYLLLAGLVLAAVGLNGLMSPDSWLLASAPFGQVFNLLPELVHRAVGGLFLVGGGTQALDAAGVY